MAFIVLHHYTGGYFVDDLSFEHNIEGTEYDTCVIIEYWNTSKYTEISREDAVGENCTIVRTIVLVPNPDIAKWLVGGFDSNQKDDDYGYAYLTRKRRIECRRINFSSLEEFQMWLTEHNASLVAGSEHGVVERHVIVVDEE